MIHLNIIIRKKICFTVEFILKTRYHIKINDHIHLNITIIKNFASQLNTSKIKIKDPNLLGLKYKHINILSN